MIYPTCCPEDYNAQKNLPKTPEDPMQLYTQECEGPKELPSLRARHFFSLLEYGVIMIKSALSNLGHMAQLNPLLASFVNGLRDQILRPAYCKRCRFQQVVPAFRLWNRGWNASSACRKKLSRTCRNFRRTSRPALEIVEAAFRSQRSVLVEDGSRGSEKPYEASSRSPYVWRASKRLCLPHFTSPGYLLQRFFHT